MFLESWFMKKINTVNEACTSNINLVAYINIDVCIYT